MGLSLLRPPCSNLLKMLNHRQLKCFTLSHHAYIVTHLRENALLNERLKRSEQASASRSGAANSLSDAQRSAQGTLRTGPQMHSARSKGASSSNRPPPVTPFTPAVLRQSFASPSSPSGPMPSGASRTAMLGRIAE